jgi:nicotinamidase-related amidase
MNTIDEISAYLQPARTVLVLWDIQKMLVEAIFNKDEFLRNVQTLAKAAREKNIPVIFTRITPLPERFESPGRRYMMRNRPKGYRPAPDAFDLIIGPERDDIVIDKNTASIFVGTNFELMVRNAGISTIVFTGISTEIGIESSARDAGNRGFFPVIVQDAVSSRDRDAHNRSLENLKNMIPLVSTGELAGFWKNVV